MAVAAARIPGAHKHSLKVDTKRSTPWYIRFYCVHCLITCDYWRNVYHRGYVLYPHPGSSS